MAATTGFCSFYQMAPLSDIHPMSANLTGGSPPDQLLLSAILTAVDVRASIHAKPACLAHPDLLLPKHALQN
jgi:hypothetical protein